MSNFEDIKQLAGEIQAGNGERDKMFNELEDMFFLNNDDAPDADWIKDTSDPDVRTKLIGASRLMNASDPEFSVPHDREADQTVKGQASRAEEFAKAIWRNVCQVRGRRLHADITLSALLYGEIDLTVYTTAERVKLAKTPADKARLEAVAQRTPLMFDILNPKICYPVYDNYGLSAHYATRQMRVVDVMARWGELPELEQLGRYKTTTYHEYWDNKYHIVWISDMDKPLLEEEHNLTRIPIISVIAEGSELFLDSDQHTRQPFLYTEWKSNLWKRRNLILTLAYSMAFSIGSNPLFVANVQDPDKPLSIDYSKPGAVLKLRVGENFQPLARQIIDPSLMQLFDIAGQKGTESTIYNQSLGEPLGSNAPFSMVALLSQSGRLPLVPYQRMSSHAIGMAMTTGMELLRGGGTMKVTGEGKTLEFDPKELPENFEIEAKLDVQMPQDKKQNAEVALMGSGGESPLFSQRYAREEIMGIGQSDLMQEEIWSEQAAAVEQMAAIQKRMAEVQNEINADMQGGAMGGEDTSVPPEMMGAGGATTTQPPETLGQDMMGGGQFMPPPQSAQPGSPMTEPLMPEGM